MQAMSYSDVINYRYERYCNLRGLNYSRTSQSGISARAPCRNGGQV